MATLKGPIWTNYHKLNISGAGARGIDYGLRAREAVILFRRLEGGAIQTVLGDRAPNVNNQPEIDTWRYSQQKPDVPEVFLNEHASPAFQRPRIDISDYVAIIDVDVNGKDQGIEEIKLPFIPRDVEVSPESVFAAIKPIGRNNAKYHYTGSEDKISFEIDWYSFNYNRDDVITNCRKIEALSKADAYNGSPHRVMIKWGAGDVLFDGQYFVVLSASYKLSHFNKSYVSTTGYVKDTHLLPVQAYQKVVLGRITSSNLTKKQISYVKNQYLSSI